MPWANVAPSASDLAGFPKDTFYYYKANWRANLNNTLSAHLIELGRIELRGTLLAALQNWRSRHSKCVGMRQRGAG